MHVIGPHGRPLDEEQYVSLGGEYGSTDYCYYFAADGNVWCFESPNNGYSPSRWYVIESDRLARVTVDGKALQQLVQEHSTEGRRNAGPGFTADPAGT